MRHLVALARTAIVAVFLTQASQAHAIFLFFILPIPKGSANPDGMDATLMQRQNAMCAALHLNAIDQTLAGKRATTWRGKVAAAAQENVRQYKSFGELRNRYGRQWQMQAKNSYQAASHYSDTLTSSCISAGLPATKEQYDSWAQKQDAELLIPAEQRHGGSSSGKSIATGGDAASILMGIISAKVRDGQCQDAKITALNAGRMDLADQAMRLCVPAPTPTKPPSASSVRSIRDNPPVAAPASASQQPGSREYVPPSAEQIEENKKLYFRRRVVELVSQGYCESAVQMASSIGEPELAKLSGACRSATTE